MPEGREGLEREGFRAGLGGDAGVGEGGGDGGRIEVGGAEVVGEGFALLCEDLTEEGEERPLGDCELGKAGSKAPAEDGGVDLWRRGKCVGRQGEEGFDGAVKLGGDGEQAVVAGAGASRDAVCHFTLDHEDGAFEGCVRGGEVEQDGRSDVVRQIAGDEERAAGLCGGGFEIELEHVLCEDGEIFGGNVGAEVRGEFGVQLNGEQMGAAGGEGAGDGAAAGADFDDGAAIAGAEGGDDALDGLGVVKEVLAELGTGGHD